MPQKTLKVVCKKILLDQIIGATFSTFLFIVSTSLLDGYSLKQALNENIKQALKRI